MNRANNELLEQIKNYAPEQEKIDAAGADFEEEENPRV